MASTCRFRDVHSCIPLQCSVSNALPISESIENARKSILCLHPAMARGTRHPGHAHFDLSCPCPNPVEPRHVACDKHLPCWPTRFRPGLLEPGDAQRRPGSPGCLVNAMLMPSPGAQPDATAPSAFKFLRLTDQCIGSWLTSSILHSAFSILPSAFGIRLLAFGFVHSVFGFRYSAAKVRLLGAELREP